MTHNSEETEGRRSLRKTDFRDLRDLIKGVYDIIWKYRKGKKQICEICGSGSLRRALHGTGIRGGGRTA